jgi:8-oxo-dGTP pyrophosphatase MutT (NUDIX family)
MIEITEHIELFVADLNYPTSEFPFPLKEVKAACTLVVNPKTRKILATSRKNNHSDLGLPGGKVDIGETSFQAAVRELWEETGYVISDLSGLLDYYKNNPNHVITLPNHSYVTTFLIPIHFVSGFLIEHNIEDNFISVWTEVENLYSESSSFSEYNKLLLSSNYI